MTEFVFWGGLSVFALIWLYIATLLVGRAISRVQQERQRSKHGEE